MRALFSIIIYVIIKFFILALALGVGWLLNWLLPSIDFGSAVLIGVVATIGAMYLLAKFIRFVDAEVEAEVKNEALERITYILDAEPPRRQRRRKQHTTTP